MAPIQRWPATLLGVFAIGALFLAACVPSEQASPSRSDAPSEPDSKYVVLQACYPVEEAELEHARALVSARPSAAGNIYWWWRAIDNTATLARVNAETSVDLNSTCLNQMATTCGDLGLAPLAGFVSRRQAANGLGEFTFECSSRLEQL